MHRREWRGLGERLTADRVTAEAVADAFSDGLTAVELRFSPQFIADMTGLDPDDVIEGVYNTYQCSMPSMSGWAL